MSEEKETPRTVKVVNLTTFFNREMYMYALGDIKFKKPISLKRVVYTFVFLFVWTLPLILIFGFPTNIFSVAFFVGIPVGLGWYAGSPVWGGRGLISFLKIIIQYISQPAGWMDLKPAKNLHQTKFYTDHSIWIGRRRELRELADLKEKRDQGKQ